MDIRWIDSELLENVGAEARASERGRKNRNLHAMEDPVHRLLNALEPGTYIRPHRHAEPPKTETAIVLRGRIGLLAFDDAGAVIARRELDAAGPVFGADIPAGAWHTFVALEPSVFFETKPGPYAPPGPGEVAPWAPAEGAPDAPATERSWRAQFEGRRHEDGR